MLYMTAFRRLLRFRDLDDDPQFPAGLQRPCQVPVISWASNALPAKDARAMINVSFFMAGLPVLAAHFTSFRAVNIILSRQGS